MVGPSAVPVLGANYVQREATGLMTIRKESPSVHLLKLQHLLPEDAGKYICRVTEREKTPTGDFIDRSKRSRNVQITVTPLSEYSFLGGPLRRVNEKVNFLSTAFSPTEVE